MTRGITKALAEAAAIAPARGCAITERTKARKNVMAKLNKPEAEFKCKNPRASFQAPGTEDISSRRPVQKISAAEDRYRRYQQQKTGTEDNNSRKPIQKISATEDMKGILRIT